MCFFWGESGTQQSSNSVPVYDAGGKSIQITAPTNTPQGQEPEARLLHMMDGATRATTWSYEMPYGEFKNSGGLKGIQVAPDLVGADGIQDIVGYREDTVFIFSGKNGTLSTFPVGQPIASLDVIRNGASGNAIAVGIAGGLMIFDGAGTPLWTTTSAGWVGDGTGSFMMLDDINSDNVSDLAVTSAAKIVVLKSVAATDNYELHLTFKAETGYSIGHAETVPDQNKDGVKDLVFFQHAQASQQGGQTPCPLLSQTSPVDGKELFKVNSPLGVMAYDLACGDFNGDGYADSLFSCYEGNICGSTPSSQGEHIAGIVYLWVLSGKDGTTLRMRPFDEEDLYGVDGGSTRSEVPVTNVGDADGDGADDLASRFAPRGKSTYSSSGISSSHSFTSSRHQQSGLEIYSIAQDSVVRSIPTSLLIGSGYFSQGNTGMLRADVDADGHAEVIDKAFEPR